MILIKFNWTVKKKVGNGIPLFRSLKEEKKKKKGGDEDGLWRCHHQKMQENVK
jgi:hypothetical protein